MIISQSNDATVASDKGSLNTQDGAADRVGSRLRAVRTDRSLTLERLAEQSGLTRGYLSLLERGLKTPSLAALVRIADALRIDVTSLFDKQRGTEPAYVVYRHGPIVDTDLGQRHTVPLAPDRFGKVMEPFFIRPSFKLLDRVTHSGDELIVVLSGRLLVRLGGEELILDVNDSLYFTASKDHQLQSLGTTQATVLVVVSRNPTAMEVNVDRLRNEDGV